MRWLFLLASLAIIGCSTADDRCHDCKTEDQGEHAEPAMSGPELERQLDEIESQIDGDAGAQ